MKPILLPTDFSENSKSALRYGLEIAKRLKAEVIFFHANHVPVIAPNTPVGVYDNLIITDEKKQKESLEHLKSTLYLELGLSEEEVPSKCVVRLGFAVDEIVNEAEDENVGLIIIGTEGASGLQKALVGTNAASAIKKSHIPVLTVPTGTIFNGIRKIALATDFHHVEDKNIITPLLEMALLFDAEILIFNIRKDKSTQPSFEEAAEGFVFEEAFSKVKHSYFLSENKNITQGIEDFVKEHKADLLVMMPHKQGFWEGLFSTSYSQEVAQDAVSPLLTLPGRQ
jgi:nucleotide-binding universal stress UspA family protein